MKKCCLVVGWLLLICSSLVIPSCAFESPARAQVAEEIYHRRVVPAVECFYTVDSEGGIKQLQCVKVD